MDRKSFIFVDGVLVARTVTNAGARRKAAMYTGDVRIVDGRKAQVISRNVSTVNSCTNVFKFLNGGK